MIDNFSRLVLAYRVTTDISKFNTIKAIREAKSFADNQCLHKVQWILADPGSENNNHEVRKFILSQNMKLALAQVDTKFSNSMIEALFRTVKQRSLYLHRLRSLSSVKRRLANFIRQYNEEIPHTAFEGATPKEMYFGTWRRENQQDLYDAKLRAAVIRKQENAKPPCGPCPLNGITSADL